MMQSERIESVDGFGAGEQLAYIESMIREGRRTTEYWGWTLVLWGVAYLVAIAWQSVPFAGKSLLWAWPVTMTLAGVLTSVIARRKRRGEPVTMRSRAIWSVWMAVGFGITLFAFPAVFAHRYMDGHIFMAAIEILLGLAHIASGLILRWRTQVAIGGLWWLASLVTTLTQSNMGVAIPFLAGTFICNIGFGVYLMLREARDKATLRAGQVAHV